MTSFIQQPLTQEYDALSTPKEQYKKRNISEEESMRVTSSLQSSIRGSYIRNSTSSIKPLSIEERGLTYGKVIKSFQREFQGESSRLRRAPKIDCSNGPSEIINSPHFFLSQAYTEVNPEKSIKVEEIKSEITEHSQKEEKDSPQKIKDYSPVQIEIPLKNEPSSTCAKKQGNSSAIRQKKSRTQYEITTFVLLFILLCLILIVKHQQSNKMLNTVVVPSYYKYVFFGIFE